METQHRTLQTHPGSPTPSAESDAAAADALAACRRLADAADSAIDQAYSGDAAAFLAANKQDGGQ